MRKTLFLATALIGFGTTASAGTISFDTDPFAGTTALTTAGRQVIGGELFTDFDVKHDVFQFDPAVFGVNSLSFANEPIGGIPNAGTNLAVLRTFDNDNNPATAFGAGQAANILADQITASGAGFFIYFNSGLDLARLVFSTDLSDATADLKILARLTNFTGQNGRDAMAEFNDRNFATTNVPEPATLGMFAVAAAGLLFARRRRAAKSDEVAGAAMA
jgi:PEP-CTERM motif